MSKQDVNIMHANNVMYVLVVMITSNIIHIRYVIIAFL